MPTLDDSIPVYLVIDTFEDKIVHTFLKEIHVWEFLISQSKAIPSERYNVVTLNASKFFKD